uniref:Uncharacterized protein n=1 Tax=Peronospora matthiolae TaxID=2874970 RepID=A0AAV1V388_9STRA
MRILPALVATAAVLLMSCDHLAYASSDEIKKDGVYAKFYRIRDGTVVEKKVVYLGDSNQSENKTSDQDTDGSTTQEERFSYLVPIGLNNLRMISKQVAKWFR